MTPNRLGLFLGLLLGTFVVISTARPVQAGCKPPCWTRTCAKSYGETAVNEPYRVTHAEWIDDDQRTWDLEGVDCSGLVHKTWAMKDARGSTAFFWWWSQEELPEKYGAGGFYNNCASTYACRTVCTGGNCPMSSTVNMDAFATLNDPANPNDDHVGLIYEEISNSQDRILEAVDDPYSDNDVHIALLNWRTDPHYRGIKRETWSISCSSCQNSCPVALPLIQKNAGNSQSGSGDSGDSSGDPGDGSGTDNPYPSPYP